MVKRNVYISVFLVGMVFAFLNQITTEQSLTTTTLIYLTFFSLLVIKLVDEWRYYRSYNAPLASAIFIGIPAIIGILGSLIASDATLGDVDNILQIILIDLNFNLEFLQLDTFYLFFNLFSLIFCLPFFLILTVLFRRYYSGTYPNIFIFRRRFPSETIISFNAIFIVVFGIVWFDQRTIEISAFVFLIFSIFSFLQNYVFKFVIIPFKRVSRPSRQTSRSVQTQRRSTRPSQRPSVARQSTSQTQRVSSSQRATRRTTHASTVKVAPPVQMPTRTKRKLSPALIASLIPAGQHITRDDFRCIYCYEFPTESDKQVVICPHCKHPSHADEFQKWLSVSNICSRCNKPIKNVKMIRLSGSSYMKIIQMFKKN